jgi:hypothetical protein
MVEEVQLDMTKAGDEYDLSTTTLVLLILELQEGDAP